MKPEPEQEIRVRTLETQVEMLDLMLLEFRQGLADAQRSLAEANASGKLKDREIQRLIDELEKNKHHACE